VRLIELIIEAEKKGASKEAEVIMDHSFSDDIFQTITKRGKCLYLNPLPDKGSVWI